MPAKRAHISLSTKLAAALLTMERYRLAMTGRTADANDLYHDAKQMTAAHILSLFQFDHFPIRHADGGPGEPWNLCPTMIKAHRTKTSKVDQPGLAKQRRIEGKWREFTRAAAKGRKPPRRKSKWPKRTMNRRVRCRRQRRSMPKNV